MSTLKGGGDQPKAESYGQGGGRQPNVDVCIKKNHFNFFFIIWKYFVSNMNLIFEYSALEKIRLDCKVYLSPNTHTPFAYIASLLQKQKLLSNLSVYIHLMGYKLE